MAQPIKNSAEKEGEPMRKAVLFFVAGLVCSLLLFSGAASAEKTLINGIDANYPPFAYVNKAGEPDGFDVDAVNWIADEMGFEVKHQPMDWDGIIPNLRAKKIDFIASGMSITEERKKVVNFTIPYWEVKKVLVVKEGSDLSVEEIMAEQGTIGVQRGTTSAEWLKEQSTQQKGKWNYTLRYYDSAPSAVADVVNGRIEAAAMDQAPAADAAGKRPVTILGTFGMHSESFGYAVRKEDKELLKTLNEGLRKLMDSPYWEELKAKYKPGQH
jgi:polar amino acid transport system substrate-binding protein